MADLSVTDVQKVLREHAMRGHDILKDPRTVHLGGVMAPHKETAPFGIPLLHKLYINKGLSEAQLHSIIMHGEKPTGTSVNSWISLGPSGSSLQSREASKIHPAHERGRSEFTSFAMPEENDPLPEGLVVPQDEHNYFGKALKKGGMEATHDDIHVALHNQANSPVLYTFHDKDYSTRHNDGRWNIKEALENTTAPLKPFSGLVPVAFGNHLDGITNWIYDPQTEQLTRVNQRHG